MLNGLSKFGRGHHDKHFHETILNLNQWFRRRCRLNAISYLELLWPFCLTEQNHLCKFGRGHYEKDLFEIFFLFGPVLWEEMSF